MKVYNEYVDQCILLCSKPMDYKTWKSYQH